MKKKTFAEFWPFYLSQHLNPVSRRLHALGTLSGLVVAVIAFSLQSWAVGGGAFVCGYAFAWVGHFVFEKNRPATFRQPFFSFAADFVLLFKMITGQLDAEIRELKQATGSSGKSA